MRLLIASILLLSIGFIQEPTLEVQVCFNQCDWYDLFEHGKCAFYDIEQEVATILKADLIVDKHSDIKDGHVANIGGLMHHKFCLKDNLVLFGSANPTYNGVNKNKNHWILLHNKEIAQLFGIIHNDLKKDQLLPYDYTINAKDISLRALHCVNICSNAIIELIQEAQHNITFMIFTFTDMQIATKLIEAQQRGIYVEGKLEPASASHDVYAYLQPYLNVTWYQGKGLLHHKVFIVDDTVVVGSYNPTRGADAKNADLLVMITNKEIANAFRNAYASI